MLCVSSARTQKTVLRVTVRSCDTSRQLVVGFRRRDTSVSTRLLQRDRQLVTVASARRQRSYQSLQQQQRQRHILSRINSQYAHPAYRTLRQLAITSS